jgi:hypothetical protein
VAAHRVDGVLPDGHDDAVGIRHDLLTPTTNFLQGRAGFFIGAVLLWDILFRGQLGVSLTFIRGAVFAQPRQLVRQSAAPA